MSTDTKAVLETLAAKRATLAQARAAHDTKKATLDALRQQFEQQHADLIAEVDTLKEAESAADADLRDEVLKVYAADLDNKKPLPGLEIKLWDVMDFDKAEAEVWARQNMPALLVLDTSAYKKVLKEVAASKVLSSVIIMPGVVRQEPKVSVARDLSAYLPAVVQEPEPAKAGA